MQNQRYTVLSPKVCITFDITRNDTVVNECGPDCYTSRLIVYSMGGIVDASACAVDMGTWCPAANNSRLVCHERSMRRQQSYNRRGGKCLG